MLKHYIKFAFRNFKSNRIIFGGSLLTLCLGALCISLLYSYVPDQLNMDDFHERQKDIYAITIKRNSQSLPEVDTPNSYVGFDYNDYPELESFTSIEKYKKGELKLTYENTTFSAEGIVTDSTFFKIFDFKLKVGDEETVLKDPDALLLTEKFATKMFGNEDPIGKIIAVKNRREKNFTVKGILENPPQNSSIVFDFVFPEQYNDPNLFSRMGGSFILAGDDFDPELFRKKIKHLYAENPRRKESISDIIPFNYKEINKSGLQSIGIFSRTVNENNLYIQIIIMLVILIISALNFSNLQVINSNARVKNSALKMVNGANKKHIIKQMLVEMALLVGIATIITTIVYQLVLPAFMSFTNITISQSLSSVIQMNFCILLVLALLGLVYPLFVTLKIPLIKSLKNQILSQNQLKGKRVVVVFQYALTFILLISSIIVARQLQLMLDKDLGYQQKNIISAQIFNLPTNIKNQEEADAFLKTNQYEKNELAAHSSIKNFAEGQKPMDAFTMDWKSNEGEYEMETHNTLKVSPNYEKVLGLQLVEGRFFDSSLDKSRGKRVVINEAAKKYWDIKDISGKKMINGSWGEYEIIGVVKDFNYQHLSANTQPLVMLYMENFEDPFLIEFEEGAMQSGLAYISQFFKERNPKETFNYSFLEDDVAAQYQKEKQLSINYILFTIIALIISMIGLFSIAIYDTKRRVKEIAVRKVNGAKVTEILSLLNKSFIRWVGVAFIIACPIVYVSMQKWLEGFAYKTAVSWWIFALAGVFTLVIALLTVSWQSYKAAMANPVKSLRAE